MKTIYYMVWYLDKLNRVNVAGIYPEYEQAQARLEYVEEHFSFGRDEWQISDIPYIEIDFNSIMVVNKKD